MRLIRVLPWTLTIGFFVACGGNDSGGNGDGQGMPLEELPALYAEAACTAYTTCIGDLFALFRPGEDCVKNTTVQLEEQLGRLSELVGKGRVKYYGTKAQACLDEVAASGCEFVSKRSLASCDAVLIGTAAEGEDCEIDEECEGEQYCKSLDACPGKCTSLERAGGPCRSNDDCMSGLKCGETLRCVAPATAGAPCKQSEPDCENGYICLGGDDATKMPGKCQELAEAFSGKLGDVCDLSRTLCASGTVCEIKKVAPLGGECVAKVGSGKNCRAAFPDQCPDDEFCSLGTDPSDLAAGKCTPRPLAGEACGKSLGTKPEVCAPNTRCDNGLCRELAHLGEKCTQNATCYSDHCEGGACVASNSCE